MKFRNRGSMIVVLGMLLPLGYGCSAYTAAPASSSCPSAGTEVPFAKLVTPGYAQDYVGCNVTTVAQFVATGSGAWMLPVPTDGKAVFRVLPPGAIGEKNPLSGEIQANFVVIPKEAGELSFKLKPGDLVRMTGGNYVKGLSTIGKLASGGGDFSSIVFLATSMSSAQP